MTRDIIWPRKARFGACALGAAGWLSLAAAPTFAAMALVATVHGDAPPMLCSDMQGTSPLNGMAAMYLLMSVFHLAPWLKLISRGARPTGDASRNA